jgi:predicted nucleic acid-binding protein
MGLILDSSVLIAAERNREAIKPFLKRVEAATGDQEAALSSVGLTELAHGAYRAHTLDLRTRRERFVEDLLRVLQVFPYSKSTALLAARIDGEQQARGVTIPFSDLLIGATALEAGYAVATSNLRHFRMIPGLEVIQL